MFTPPRITRSRALIAAFALAATAGSAAHADPNGGDVIGAIELPPPAARPELPVRSQGFIKRIRGPLKPPRKLDVRPQLVVVLDGGPVTSADAEPGKRKLRYQIVGEAFESPVFPFVAGAEIEIKNSSGRSVELFSPTHADALPERAIKAKGEAAVKAIAEPYQRVQIRDRGSAHLEGSLVSLPHAYFSTVTAGKFEIRGVPAGKWTVRVWYRDGWVKLGREVTVDVVAKKKTKAASIKLPAELDVTSPAAGGN